MREISVDTGKSSCVCHIYWNGKANVMVVDDVKTEAEHRGRGYATEMMSEVMKEARRFGVDSIELLVNPDNKAAIGLYEKFEMKPTNKIHYRRLLNKWT